MSKRKTGLISWSVGFRSTFNGNFASFNGLIPAKINAGIPSQLLANRPDIRQAELNLEAAKLDVTVAKANFYPTLNVDAFFGIMAYNPLYLVYAPQSLVASLLGV